MDLIGRAMPVLAVEVFEEKVTGTNNKLMEKPFGLTTELFVKALQKARGQNEKGLRGGQQRRRCLGKMRI